MLGARANTAARIYLPRRFLRAPAPLVPPARLHALPAMASSSSTSSAAAPAPGVIPQPLAAVPSVPPGARTITEGAAVILYAGKDAVFYNRVQIFNRDLTMTVVRCYDAARRAAAKPRDVRKAWHRRRLLQGLFPVGGAAAAPAAASTDDASTYTGPRLFPAPPPALMTKWQPGGTEAAAGVPVVPRGTAAAGAPSTDADEPTELPGLRVLEALSASGLRSVRYAREVPGLDHVVCNDLDPAAVASIGVNVAFNGVTPPGRVQPSQADASLLLYLCREPHFAFDVVDLDPYGTATPFLDGAVQAVVDGGLLAITCTDMPVLASQQHPDVCHAKYGATPVRGRHCHEQALRIVLAATEAAANRYGRSIRPLLSVSVDFYVRIFVTVHVSADAANGSPADRLGHLHQCTGCDAYWVTPKGERSAHKRGGPKKAAAAAAAAAGAEVEGGGDDAPAEGGGAGGDDAPLLPPHRKRARVDAAAAAAASSSAAGAAAPAGAPAARTGKVHAPHVPHVPGPNCPHCGHPVQLGGPIWAAPIHDAAFAAAVLGEAEATFGEDGMGVAGATTEPHRYYDLHDDGAGAGGKAGRVIARADHDAGSNDVDTVALSRRRLQGVLRCIAGELPDVPLYYELASLSSRMHVTCPTLPAVQAALMHAGYRVSGSHAIMGALKTDAPPEVVWGVMAAWVAAPGQAAPHKPQPAGSVGAALLASGAAVAAARPTPFNFVPSGAVAEEIVRQRSVGPRYLPNPGDAWGPGSRASAAKAESKAAAREAAKAAATAATAAADADAPAPASS